MNKTENYALPQWEESDRILMEDFNSMTEGIDAALAENKGVIEAAVAAAGNCKVITGTYTGTGTYNKTETAVKLTFPARPALLLIAGGSAWAVIANMYTGHTFSSTDGLCSLSVNYDDATGVGYWLSTCSQQSQMNMSSATYNCFAFYL